MCFLKKEITECIKNFKHLFFDKVLVRNCKYLYCCKIEGKYPKNYLELCQLFLVELRSSYLFWCLLTGWQCQIWYYYIRSISSSVIYKFTWNCITTCSLRQITFRSILHERKFIKKKLCRTGVGRMGVVGLIFKRSEFSFSWFVNFARKSIIKLQKNLYFYSIWHYMPSVGYLSFNTR